MEETPTNPQPKIKPPPENRYPPKPQEPKYKAPPPKSFDPLVQSNFAKEAKSGLKVPVASMPPEQAAQQEETPQALKEISRVAVW